MILEKNMFMVGRQVKDKFQLGLLIYPSMNTSTEIKRIFNQVKLTTILRWSLPKLKLNGLDFINLCIPFLNSISIPSTSVAWLLIAAVFCAKHSHFLTEFPPHWWMAWQERTTTIEWTDWDRELWKEPIYSPQKETIHHVGTAIFETEQP
jgi:hypothetical protein